ncbi:hypothetical protein [Pararhodobacter sp. CCB-MM2]|uniref:hypothetical protein n=1 Tax=Pararhodobacter sp. CCB-MM2 TaxID=1786003 RepID=UPI0008302E22|nr:hypothetical protein [Pararhodobacter sp. CCB-MM2]
MSDLSRLPHLLSRQDWAGAEALLRRALIDPKAPAALAYNLAKVLELQGKDGVEWLRRCVAQEPRHADGWFELGRALMVTDFAGAEAAFAHSVALKPAADAWLNLARLRLRLGDWAGCGAALAQLPQTAETRAMAYRVACETGSDTSAQRADLLSRASERPEALKALTRTAKGHLPLRLPQAR